MLIHVGPEEMPGRWVTGSMCYSEDSSLPHVCLLTGISSHTPTCPRKNIVSLSLSPSALPPRVRTRTHTHTPSRCCALLVNSLSKPLLLRICSSRLNPSPFWITERTECPPSPVLGSSDKCLRGNKHQPTK